MTAPKPPLIVLVVDDEKGIRMLERRVLEAEGYTVIEAGSGLEAIALLATGAHADLLLADLERQEEPLHLQIVGASEVASTIALKRAGTSLPRLKFSTQIGASAATTAFDALCEARVSAVLPVTHPP